MIACSGCDVVLGLQRNSDDAAPIDDGHDEDGDSLTDLVDPCPADAGDAVDSDGDNVGDVCDPDDRPIDRRAYFEPFARPPVDWTLTSGAWTYRDDLLASNAIGMVSTTEHDVGQIDHATFEATFDATRPVFSSTGVRMTFADGTVIGCLVNVGGGGETLNIYLGQTAQQTTPFSGGRALHLYVTHVAADNSIRCRAREANGLPTTINFATSIAASANKIAIVAQGSSIEVQSALVFGTR